MALQPVIAPLARQKEESCFISVGSTKAKGWSDSFDAGIV
jgi:hypothetical protein